MGVAPAGGDPFVLLIQLSCLGLSPLALLCSMVGLFALYFIGPQRSSRIPSALQLSLSLAVSIAGTWIGFILLVISLTGGR